MMSKTAVHALKAVVALAELSNNGFEGASSLAERIGAPQNYLGKLLQALARAGVLQSQKGSRGGFQLARSPESISLFDIVEPIDHVSRWAGCLMGQAKCSELAPCALHDGWETVRNAYLSMLETSTVADILARNQKLLTAAPVLSGVRSDKRIRLDGNSRGEPWRPRKGERGRQ